MSHRSKGRNGWRRWGTDDLASVFGWLLVAGVAAIAGLPPFGVFTSEFLIVTSTFEREPLLAILFILGLLLAFGALLLRLTDVAFGEVKGPIGPVHASYLPVLAHLSLVLAAGIWLPRCWSHGSNMSRRCSDDGAGSLVERRPAHAGAAAAAASPGVSGDMGESDGVLAAGELTLLSLWGDTSQVHMALLDPEDHAIGVVTLPCHDGHYPSVGLSHPPAIRLERALRDLYGYVPDGCRTTPLARFIATARITRFCRWRAKVCTKSPLVPSMPELLNLAIFVSPATVKPSCGWSNGWVMSIRALMSC